MSFPDKFIGMVTEVKKKIIGIKFCPRCGKEKNASFFGSVIDVIYYMRFAESLAGDSAGKELDEDEFIKGECFYNKAPDSYLCENCGTFVYTFDGDESELTCDCPQKESKWIEIIENLK